MTITKGETVGQAGGGGILNDVNASLTMKQVVASGNQAIAASGSDVFGGGLLNYGTATISSCVFTAALKTR
jgi:hypothetical protein